MWSRETGHDPYRHRVAPRSRKCVTISSLFVFITFILYGAMNYTEVGRTDRAESLRRAPTRTIPTKRTGSSGRDSQRTKTSLIHYVGETLYQSHSTCEKSVERLLADPVIVIGTDGSGTRVPTLAIAGMGVTVLVEPSVASQMDVDGSRVNVHFTTAIREIMCHTAGRVDYELASLPPAFARQLLEAFAPWVDFLRNEACAAARRDSSWDGSSPFRWGFKKPDLLHLLPVLLHFWPNARVVHVVRDGRDMALSRNDAALQKYASQIHGEDCGVSNAHIENSHEDIKTRWKPLPVPTIPSLSTLSYDRFVDLPEPVQKARLWAYQNAGVERWALRRATNARQLLRIRIEDMNAASDRSIETYARVGAFVTGSHATTSFCSLCSLRSSIRNRFMGSHDDRAAHSHRAALSQYGKWTRLVREDLSLLRDVENHVRPSLEWFGYHPHTSVDDGDQTTSPCDRDEGDSHTAVAALCSSCPVTSTGEEYTG